MFRRDLSEIPHRNKENATPEKLQQIEAERKQLRTEKEMLNVLVSAVTGYGAEGLTQAAVAKAADYMRDKMKADSNLSKGMTDGKTVLSNQSGPSIGVDGDAFKLGGTRLDLHQMCNVDNVCQMSPDGKTIATDANGYVHFDGHGKYADLQKYLDSDKGKTLRGLTGGIQGDKGTIFGKDYYPGSTADQVIEAFAGSHDYTGGHLPGLYDEQGNKKQDLSQLKDHMYNHWSEVAVPINAPIAAAKILPSPVWDAIQKLVLNR